MVGKPSNQTSLVELVLENVAFFSQEKFSIIPGLGPNDLRWMGTYCSEHKYI